MNHTTRAVLLVSVLAATLSAAALWGARDGRRDKRSVNTLVGNWQAMTPMGPQVVQFHPDGTFLSAVSGVSTERLRWTMRGDRILVRAVDGQLVERLKFEIGSDGSGVAVTFLDANDHPTAVMHYTRMSR